MNQDLLRAIAEKRLIEFVYRRGQTRLVEPHDYGIRGGVESLLGFQIGGESRSGVPHGWKQFDVDETIARARAAISGNTTRQRAASSEMGRAVRASVVIARVTLVNTTLAADVSSQDCAWRTPVVDLRSPADYP